MRTAAYGLPYPEPRTAAVTMRMRANRSVETRPEVALRSALHRLGYRFRKQYLVRAGGRRATIDLAFPTDRLAVFVDGCFWHHCPEHGSVPRTNSEYWGPKLAKNVERDWAVSCALESDGWTVLRIWEHVDVGDAVQRVSAKLEALRSQRYPTAVDLFAGAGGSTQGLKDAGFKVVAAVENDPSAASSYASNHPRVRLFEEDIRDVDPGELARVASLNVRELDLLVACPPCQGFSTLGASRRDDPRNDLVTLVEPFLTVLRPRAFVLENVPGLQGDRRLGALVAHARALGYGIKTYLVNATAFGVPQSRRRLIVLGARALSEEALPPKLEDVLPSTFRRRPPRVADVLAKAGPIEGTSDSVHRSRRNSVPVLARIQQVPPGGSRFDLSDALQLDCHKALLGKVATSSYGRMRLDRPAPTMTTRCTTPACGRFVHPTEDRGISLREAALLQTFPRRYRFHGSHQSLEAQIGNAVPVRMACALGLVANALIARATDV